MSNSFIMFGAERNGKKFLVELPMDSQFSYAKRNFFVLWNSGFFDARLLNGCYEDNILSISEVA